MINEIIQEKQLTVVNNNKLYYSNFIDIYFNNNKYETISTNLGNIFQNNNKQLIILNDNSYEIDKIGNLENTFCFTRNDDKSQFNIFKTKTNIISNKPIISFPLLWKNLNIFLQNYQYGENKKDESFYKFLNDIYDSSKYDILFKNDDIHTIDFTMWMFEYINTNIYKKEFNGNSYLYTLENFIVNKTKDEIKNLINNTCQLHLINNSNISEVVNKSLSLEYSTKIYNSDFTEDKLIYKIDNNYQQIDIPNIKKEKNNFYKKSTYNYNMDHFVKLSKNIVNKINFIKINNIEENYLIKMQDDFLLDDYLIYNTFENFGENKINNFIEIIYNYIDKYQEINDRCSKLVGLIFNISFLYISGNNFIFYYLVKTINKLISIIVDNEIKKSLINYKQFILDIYSKYFSIEKCHNEMTTFLLSEFNGNYYFTKKDNNILIQYFNNNVNFLQPINSKYVDNTEKVIVYKKAINEYIINNSNNEDFFDDLSFNKNLNLRLLLFSSSGYELVRNIVKNEGKKSKNILTIVNIAEKLVKYFIENYNNYNPMLYHRLMTLISFKNNLKIRFNMDNNLWDNKQLAFEYYNEIKFISNNKLYYISTTVVAKYLDELVKIQNIFNMFRIHKSLEKTYLKVLNEISIFSIIEKEEIFNIEKIETVNENITEDLNIHRNRYMFYFEIAMANLSLNIFDGHSIFSSKEIHSSIEEKSLKLVEDYWNLFININHDKSRTFYVKNNFKDINYVY